MKRATHRDRHVMLYRYLDELVADFIGDTGKLSSHTSIYELMMWAFEQTKKPTEKTRFTVK